MSGKPVQTASPPLPPITTLPGCLGIVRPRRGSLGWPFTAALAGGVMVAVVVGSLNPFPPLSGWMLIAALVLWQPATEELLFRGLLQGYLARTPLGQRSRLGFSAANGITSLVFTAIHFLHQPPLWALGVFIPSLLFGYFRDLTGSIWPSLLLHVAFNAAFFLT